jgi:hypothetical protein
MRSIISRWFMFGLLLGWALTHATVFGQPVAGKASSAGDKLRANLDKNVTLDFTGQSLTDALNHFREKTGVPINVDQVALMQMLIVDAAIAGGGIPGGAPMLFQVKAINEKASQVLRKLLNAHQLAYIVVEDAVLVSTADMVIMRQMRQRVSVDLDEVPFHKAVRTLTKNHSLNLVIDPKVKIQAETPVSLQLENSGIETTVRLLAELAGLKSVRMGNVIFITTAEKAKKIRDEEPQQFDNPLNPNLPMGVQGLLAGAAMGGGVGGVMPLPAGAVPALPPQVAPPGTNAPPIPLEPLPPPKK